VDVTERYNYGLTAIMVAARRGHTAPVKILCTAGASITGRSDHGYSRSALFLAAFNGKLSLVQEQTGASISDATFSGSTVWDLICL
jgi:ankyrin repeat protein